MGLVVEKTSWKVMVDGGYLTEEEQLQKTED